MVESRLSLVGEVYVESEGANYALNFDNEREQKSWYT